MRHLVVDLSSHGFGHAGIACPVLNVLRSWDQTLKITIRTTIPARWLAQRLEFEFDYLEFIDFGMVMAGTWAVLAEESLTAYSKIHDDWDSHVIEAARRLQALAPSLLLSNVPYLSIAAAHMIGRPSVAFGAVNWADIFHCYCGHLPGAEPILHQMIETYDRADIFLQPVPAMSMPSIRRHRLVGPIARLGRRRGAELRRRFNIRPDDRIVLLALGGIPTNFTFDSWPRFADTTIILASQIQTNHPNVVVLDDPEFPFVDLIASSDAVITRPGYGTVAEAGCNGIPILLVPREGWPETPAFLDWLSRNGRVLILEECELREGDFLSKLRALQDMPAPPAPAPTGATEVADEIMKRLR